jgi:hypothetical protein
VLTLLTTVMLRRACSCVQDIKAVVVRDLKGDYTTEVKIESPCQSA